MDNYQMLYKIYKKYHHSTYNHNKRNKHLDNLMKNIWVWLKSMAKYFVINIKGFTTFS